MVFQGFESKVAFVEIHRPLSTQDANKGNKTMKMAEGFIKKVKNAVVGEKNSIKATRNLPKLGFVVESTKDCHIHLSHPWLGNHKFTIGKSPSDCRWGYNFVSQVRHAMWKVAA